jgi:hypothetical protein
MIQSKPLIHYSLEFIESLKLLAIKISNYSNEINVTSLLKNEETLYYQQFMFVINHFESNNNRLGFEAIFPTLFRAFIDIKNKVICHLKFFRVSKLTTSNLNQCYFL